MSPCWGRWQLREQPWGPRVCELLRIACSGVCRAAGDDFLHNMIKKAVEGKDINHKGQGRAPGTSRISLWLVLVLGARQPLAPRWGPPVLLLAGFGGS